MKITALIARYLLGLIFLVFGLNGFLHFIPMPPPPGVAGQFMGALSSSHYMVLIYLLQVIGAILLIVGRYVPLALALLAPIIANIFCFHAFMAPSGLPLAIVAVILWLLAAYSVRSAFAGLFEQHATAKT
jgi:putative oxidoreductase